MDQIILASDGIASVLAAVFSFGNPGMAILGGALILTTLIALLVSAASGHRGWSLSSGILSLPLAAAAVYVFTEHAGAHWTWTMGTLILALLVAYIFAGGIPGPSVLAGIIDVGVIIIVVGVGPALWAPLPLCQAGVRHPECCGVSLERAGIGHHHVGRIRSRALR